MLKQGDLTGKTFGILTVLKKGDKHGWWDCKCQCGKLISFPAWRLVGKTPNKSCGCLNHKKAPQVDMVGQKFGRLTVQSYKVRSLWNCICDCGNKVVVRGADLKSGNTKSCGCFKKDVHTKHGLTNHPLRATLKDMKSRCYNKNCHAYKYYGARGIKVCDDWKNDLQSFYDWAIKAGWEKGLTIDRIDNDGDYTPDNCQFIKNALNCKKTRLIHSTNTSGYRGVSKKKNGKYQCYYTKDRKMCYLGTYDTAKTAALVRDMAVVDAGLDYLPLNFPKIKDI